MSNVAAVQSPPKLQRLDRGNVHKSLPMQRVHLLNTGSELGSFTALVENDITLEDILTPVFWSAYTRTLRPLSLINVVRKDGTLDVELRVLSVEPGAVAMRLRDGPFVDNVNLTSLGGKGAATAEDATQLTMPEGYKAQFWPNLNGWMCNEPSGQSITNGAKGLTKQQVTEMAIAHHARATTPALRNEPAVSHPVVRRATRSEARSQETAGDPPNPPEATQPGGAGADTTQGGAGNDTTQGGAAA